MILDQTRKAAVAPIEQFISLQECSAVCEEEQFLLNGRMVNIAAHKFVYLRQLVNYSVR